MKSKKKFLILILIITILITLVGCEKNKNHEDIKNKIAKELDYLDFQIFSILNKLNNIEIRNYTITTEEIQAEQKNLNETKESEKTSGENSDEKSKSEKNNITLTKIEPKAILSTNESNVDWNSIKSEIETIDQAWGVILLDLTNANIQNTDISGFSNTLNELLISIKNESKEDTLKNIANLYSYIPKFEQQIYSNNTTQNIKQVKSYLINAYSFVEMENWTEVETNIEQTYSIFKNLVNNIEYAKDKKYKINKTYILLKELQNSLSYKDKKLFLIKYKNLIDIINIL